MRLIDTKKVVNDFKIEFNTCLYEENEDYEQNGDPSDNTRPKYAILSHTWGWPDDKTGKWAHKVDEVTYSERHKFSDPFEESLHPDKKKAYQKIYYTCRSALDLGCDYVWIDSCCIDKSNSAELTESINSMFRWYSDAVGCLVYLVDSSDMGVESPTQRLYTKGGEPCRWFSRCWTLQEILASKRLEFYDAEWHSIGPLGGDEERLGWSRSILNEISQITKIDSEALLGRVPLWEYSVEAKMNWASNRKSGRPEDVAYSLLGIFGIHMPLIYGEGAKAAFQRLQQEIIKSTPDLSLFAWHTGTSHREGQFCSILADSPSQFKFYRRICRSIPESHHTATNKGIQITSIIHRVEKGRERYFLCLENQGQPRRAVGIFLRKLGYDVFERTGESLTEIKCLESYPSAHRSKIYITTSPQQRAPESRRFKDGSIHVPPEYYVHDVVPEAAWDCESRILLGSIPCNDGIRALKVDVNKSGFRRTVGLVFRSSGIIAFDCFSHGRVSRTLFTRTHRRILMDWDEISSKIPELHSFRDELNLPDVISLRVKVLPRVQGVSQLLIDVARIAISASDPTYSLRKITDDSTGFNFTDSTVAMVKQGLEKANFSSKSWGNTSYYGSADSPQDGRKTVYMDGLTPRLSAAMNCIRR